MYRTLYIEVFFISCKYIKRLLMLRPGYWCEIWHNSYSSIWVCASTSPIQDWQWYWILTMISSWYLDWSILLSWKGTVCRTPALLTLTSLQGCVFFFLRGLVSPFILSLFSFVISPLEPIPMAFRWHIHPAWKIYAERAEYFSIFSWWAASILLSKGIVSS